MRLSAASTGALAEAADEPATGGCMVCIPLLHGLGCRRSTVFTALSGCETLNHALLCAVCHRGGRFLPAEDPALKGVTIDMKQSRNSVRTLVMLAPADGHEHRVCKGCSPSPPALSGSTSTRCPPIWRRSGSARQGLRSGGAGRPHRRQTLFSGYAINPLITLGPARWVWCPALCSAACPG